MTLDGALEELDRLTWAGDLKAKEIERLTAENAALRAHIEAVAKRLDRRPVVGVGSTVIVALPDIAADLRNYPGKRSEPTPPTDSASEAAFYGGGVVKIEPAAPEVVAWMVKDRGWNQCFTTKGQAEAYGQHLEPLVLASDLAKVQAERDALRAERDRLTGYVQDLRDHVATGLADRPAGLTWTDDEIRRVLSRTEPAKA